MTLDATALRAALVGPYATVDVVAETGSTNNDLRDAANRGAHDRTVLIADRQTAGQGRRGRGWTSPSGGLYLSVLFRPTNVPPARLPWVTLLAGVALVRTARGVGVEASLKWPNDLLVGDAKAAGVLAETTAGVAQAVVLGIGVNVAKLPDDVEPGAGGLRPTSLEDHAGPLDRTEVAIALLRELAALEERWRRADGDEPSLREEYRRHCVTLGSQVRVELARGEFLLGTARYLETDGTLVVRDHTGDDHSVSAGDVVHLRVR
ncbi:biotin--[acetyl-CoA-carboxylase] ligase [Saccharothrix texasensis]|uniref:biotin--[biotin carboxyl-carrier protein] ligase n=1 Tax=Saccharothrix texasensis TaxID=103734 RepID=A0A3N1HC92_9PSEU|nr:biotin--[acetyl-CoA-carboxylase] ligase [Saccharothrix texasensis]ROP40117.1 BirA family biotin operon repressor/biotin-[acetyl-CoA-carboxylase] ligase [Saccharothrix texasensis]